MVLSIMKFPILPNPDFTQDNSSYWKYKEYLGIGPSAHSYNGFDVRSWNVANNQQYIKKLNSNLLAKEEEILSQEDQFNEMIMIGLRTIWGVDLESLKEKFSDNILEHFQNEIKPKLEEGILIIENNHLKIPKNIGLWQMELLRICSSFR
jgi:oxygen-independent coproporphyrinogen-3 oxidase